jgi:hypothetical protein
MSGAVPKQEHKTASAVHPMPHFSNIGTSTAFARSGEDDRGVIRSPYGNHE